ncbi:putative orphan protein; putative membrane protein [Pseudoalteromonas luteoviolacea B = ATCC 29581]|nr:putative orphan protein; putative membrane protein [Pseudoalteromonas luteoviolacea B = ATCC 29581]
MLNELHWLVNLVLLFLGLGAFFINQVRVLRIAATCACTMLFLSFAFDLMSTSVVSNLSLILINTFYLFKVFTYEPINLSNHA